MTSKTRCPGFEWQPTYQHYLIQPVLAVARATSALLSHASSRTMKNTRLWSREDYYCIFCFSWFCLSNCIKYINIPNYPSDLDSYCICPLLWLPICLPSPRHPQHMAWPSSFCLQGSFSSFKFLLKIKIPTSSVLLTNCMKMKWIRLTKPSGSVHSKAE